MPDTSHWPSATARGGAIKIHDADGWVVTYWFRDPRSVVPPYAGTYGYDHFDHLNDACDRYADYERGEWSGYEARGLFPVKDGLPFGPPLDPSLVASMTREARQSARDDAEHGRLWAGRGGL